MDPVVQLSYDIYVYERSMLHKYVLYCYPVAKGDYKKICWNKISFLPLLHYLTWVFVISCQHFFEVHLI